MRIGFMPAAVAIILITSSSFAMAQGHMRGGRGAGPGMHGPSGGAFRGPTGGEPRIDDFRRAPDLGSRREFHAPRRAERGGLERGYRSERTRRAELRKLDRSQRVQRELRQNKNANRELRQGKDRSHEMRGTGEARKSFQGTREGSASTQQRVSDRHAQIEKARNQLSAENKERLHRAFDFDRARISRVKFDHNIGRRVPRHTRLFPIPLTVFGFFPYYRDFSYFVIDDDICIVDPKTYVVVDVIERGYWSAPSQPFVAELILSEDEIALVRESIPADFPDAGVQLRLALGAEIPQDVELNGFSPGVVDRMPRLNEFRFIVSADQIAIVRPADRSIALVIDKA
jgi:hypothetical protein